MGSPQRARRLDLTGAAPRDGVRWAGVRARLGVCLCGILALGEAGCSYFVTAETGYAHAFAQAPERSAAPLNGYFGAGGGDEIGGLGVGMSLRTKWSDNVQQLSLAPFFYAIAGSDSSRGVPAGAAFLLGGFDLVTGEAVAGKTSASIGSPFVELGGFFRLARTWGLTTGIAFEDDIRFNAIPDTGYVCFLVGIGTAGYGDPPH
jgi:hypothetical protein